MEFYTFKNFPNWDRQQTEGFIIFKTYLRIQTQSSIKLTLTVDFLQFAENSNIMKVFIELRPSRKIFLSSKLKHLKNQKIANLLQGTKLLSG